MTLPYRSLVFVACASTALTASPALADLTATGLWENWREIAALQGRELTAEGVEETESGLLLTGLAVVEEDESVSFSVRMDQIELVEIEGAVDLLIATPQSVFVEIEDSDAEDMKATFTLDGSALALSVKGSLETPDYTFGAEALSLSLAELTTEGAPLPAMAAIELADLSGSLFGWSAASDELAKGSVSATGVALALDVEDPESGFRIQSALNQESLEATLEATPPKQDGGYSEMDVEVGPTEISSVQVIPGQGEAASSFKQASGAYKLRVADGRADYEARINMADVTAADSRMPQGPVQFSIDESDLKFSLPLETAEDPQSVTVAMILGDITFPEALWSQADPAMAIPRNPANFALDLEADVMVTDATPPSLDALADGGPNFLPLGFRLSGLALEIAGAKLEAMGDFVFEAGGVNSPIPGSLNPVGELDLSVSGGLTLLQQLVAAGLVPQEQALGAQMMLGMFATPGEGDTLTSTIVSESGGGLVINGTRLR